MRFSRCVNDTAAAGDMLDKKNFKFSSKDVNLDLLTLWTINTRIISLIKDRF